MPKGDQPSAPMTFVLWSRGTGVANRVEITYVTVEKMAATILDKGTRKCLSQEMKGQHPV